MGSVQITTPASTTLHVGGTITLSAVVLNASGSSLQGRVVTWSSGDSAIATVNLNTGVVQGVKAGEVTVSASSEGKHGALRLTVLGTPASVEVSPPSASLVRGGTQNFTALVKDVNGNVLGNPSVSWSTSDAAVFTVDQNGRVTGVNTGSAQVIATSGGKQGTAQVNVAQAPVATVTLSPAETTTSVGQPVQFTLTLKDAAGSTLTGRAVVWSSSDPAIVAVTQAGAATGVAVGSATVQAASEGRTGTALVTVTAIPVATVEVSPPTAEMQVGGSAQLTGTLRSGTGETLTGRPVTWHSSAPAIASVSATGLVTGVAPGTAQVTATSEGKTGTARVDVANAPVATVQVTPATSQVNTGSSVSFSAVLRDAANRVLAGRPVSWTSSNPSVATVNASGHATGVSAGQTTITASSEGKSGTAELSVVVPAVATVSVMPDSMTLAAADTVKLIAVARDAANNVLTGRAVSWASSAPGVATITPQGVVRGVAAGRAAAIVNVEGKTGNAVIIVENPVPTLTSLSPDTATEGRSGLTLTVRGSRFVPTSRVRWNGSDRPTTYVNTGELRAVISQEDLSSPGTPQISVFNSPPGGGISGALTFEIKPSGFITLGNIVSGLISVPGEVDTYTFSGTLGRDIVVF
ncbi:MAG TPA: Ig-like domain-containing protein, partial [Longimicrobium sp.]|nr:Ig-like domain-containing protein [Longimicrobium sp.]